jgi:hypothetical protein
MYRDSNDGTEVIFTAEDRRKMERIAKEILLERNGIAGGT